jgi:hypothetical protein
MTDIIEVDASTGEVVTRKYTKAETEQRSKDQAEWQAQVAASAAKEATRQAALDKLGLTADEVAALFG